MRGKKEDFDPLYSSSNIELVDDNSISDYDNDFYEKLQTERRLLNEFGQIYGLDTQSPNEFNSEQEYNKRAPSVGFYGMRGKRNFFDDNDDATSEETESFFGMQINYCLFVKNKNCKIKLTVGMQGKNDVSDVLLNNEKRAPNSGFFGMRGKKDVSDVMISDEKRAPNSGFFGMRGKKAPLVLICSRLKNK